ncbi:unnamed protein product, partial [Discosporangium mesarthrocarpum]
GGSGNGDRAGGAMDMLHPCLPGDGGKPVPCFCAGVLSRASKRMPWSSTLAPGRSIGTSDDSEASTLKHDHEARASSQAPHDAQGQAPVAPAGLGAPAGSGGTGAQPPSTPTMAVTTTSSPVPGPAPPMPPAAPGQTGAAPGQTGTASEQGGILEVPGQVMGGCAMPNSTFALASTDIVMGPCVEAGQ